MIDTPHWQLRPARGLPESRLAWIAEIPKAGGEILVNCGSMVELADNWLVEGCWDGDFSAGNFDQCPNFFVSGIRLAADSVICCSSEALVDRLLYADFADRLIVSNSLIHLLAATGAKLDTGHDYFQECHGILEGVKSYPKRFHVTHSELDYFYQVYASNLVITGKDIQQVPRPQHQHIGSFEEYFELITQSLESLHSNATSDQRSWPFNIYSTLSSGYDSTAVTCLAMDIGASACFTTEPGNTAKSRNLEDGRRIADFLQLEAVLLDPEDESVSEDEAYYLAPTWDGSEVIFDNMSRYIEKDDRPAMVLTGYHGDKIWDRETSGKYLGDDIFRGDTSGLNLSEIRLKAGFINLAVPFMFARNAKDIVGIANQPEMRQWQLNSDYDRPVPRRIAEQYGVQRDWFGQRKRAVLSYHSTPINKVLHREFMHFLKYTAGISPWRFYLYELCGTADHYFVYFLKKLMPHKNFKDFSWSTGKFLFRQDLDLRLLMFIWAASYLSDRVIIDKATDATHDSG